MTTTHDPVREALAAEVKRLLTVATNASFDCGEWNDETCEEGTQSYIRLSDASDAARADVRAAIDALGAAATQARAAASEPLSVSVREVKP